MKTKYEQERRLLQIAVLTCACVPVFAGGGGMILGAGMFGTELDISFDSHFRYLSGLLFTLGVMFWTAVPCIEKRTIQIRTLTGLVFIGGLARLCSAFFIGWPSLPMVLAIGMELVVTPVLCAWQARIARLSTDVI